jgi:hypothetical protein
MKIRPVLAGILCGALAFSAQATPINYAQIGGTSGGQPPGTNAKSQIASQTSDTTSETVTTSLTVESLDHPEFVRLADGRLIPYGPGVICSDVCVENDVVETPPGMAKRWLIAIPIAGAAIAGILLASGDSSRPRPTAVIGTSQKPLPPTTPTPTPTVPPGDQPQPVPEPSTIALLGAGLALLSRKRVREVFQRQQK